MFHHSVNKHQSNPVSSTLLSPYWPNAEPEWKYVHYSVTDYNTKFKNKRRARNLVKNTKTPSLQDLNSRRLVLDANPRLFQSREATRSPGPFSSSKYELGKF